MATRKMSVDFRKYFKWPEELQRAGALGGSHSPGLGPFSEAHVAAVRPAPVCTPRAGCGFLCCVEWAECLHIFLFVYSP